MDALRTFNAFYDDLARSNPGFIGKLCLQNYAQMCEALCKSERLLAKYPIHMKPTPIEKALGLQAGEAYGEYEQCHTDQTKHSFMGKPFDVYYDQLAGCSSQWKAFCMGIGTISRHDRKQVIAAMRTRIHSTLRP